MDGNLAVVGLPALVLPEKWVAGRLPEGVDLSALERFGSTWRSLIDEVRRKRPGEDTTEEERVLSRMAVVGLEGLRLLGPNWVAVFREGVNAALKELLRKEMSAAETERKFALRQVEQAAHTFGVLVESVGTIFTSLPPSDARTWLADVASHVPAEKLTLSIDDRVVMRFQLDLSVALESLDAPIDELTFWAFRAATGARRVEALPSPTMPPGLRGELARLRSQRSWINWDATEIQQELAPWPPSAPSR